MHRRKKLWLDRKRLKYCTVLLFDTTREMRAYYKEVCRRSGHKYIAPTGVNVRYIICNKVTGVCRKDCGEILLSSAYCGAGVVTHEILHAVLWGHKRGNSKRMYPFRIRSLKHEEEILHDFSFAVRQFYNWYWKFN